MVSMRTMGDTDHDFRTAARAQGQPGCAGLFQRHGKSQVIRHLDIQLSTHLNKTPT